jgi:hypothetical protein
MDVMTKVAFSLTPALSRWERESRSQFSGLTRVVNCLIN